MRVNDYSEIDFKKVTKKVDLIIPAQNAKLTPPVGPVLGQMKIKVKDFCVMFNEATSFFNTGLPLPVTVYVYKNETFKFIIKTPTISFLLKNLLSSKEDKLLSLLDVYKISIIKKLELTNVSLPNIVKNVLLTSKILKISIEKI